MYWKSVIAMPTLFGALFATACSSEDAGNSDLLVTYRAHVAAAQSVVSDRMESRTRDTAYHARTTGHVKAMVSTRSEMGAQCAQIEGCSEGGGVASHGMESSMSEHMSGHMGNTQMLTAGEMMAMEAGELAMDAELDRFRTHCLDENATQETCDAYRQDHLERMAAMLDAHDAMCDRMMSEGRQGGGGQAMGEGGVATSSGGMMGSGGMVMGSSGMAMGAGGMPAGNAGMMATGGMMADGGGMVMGSGGMATNSGDMKPDSGGMAIGAGGMAAGSGEVMGGASGMPIGNDGGPGAVVTPMVGEQCLDESTCPVGGSGTVVCLRDSDPAGYCVVTGCAAHGHDCPSDGVISKCVLAPQPTCLRLCATNADCRAGYTCAEKPDAAGHGSAMACVPS